MRPRLLFAAVLAALQGCAVEPPQPTTGARPPDLMPVEVAGDYMHEPSHSAIPAQVGTFRRISVFRRGADGMRLTASYAGNGSECLTAITLFLDPAEQPGNVDKAYANAKDEVMHAYPSATLESEESRSDPGVTGKRALFLIDDRRMEVGVVARGNWNVKHRTMYPAPCTERVRDSINGFFQAWPH